MVPVLRRGAPKLLSMSPVLNPVWMSMIAPKLSMVDWLLMAEWLLMVPELMMCPKPWKLE